MTTYTIIVTVLWLFTALGVRLERKHADFWRGKWEEEWDKRQEVEDKLWHITEQED